jgi:type I restriction enzyme S subunit
VLAARDEAKTSFFKHFFKSRDFIQSLTLFVTGIREGQNIDYERLNRAELPLPTYQEQELIGRFLDHAHGRIDRAIRAKRKVIGLLNEQKQAIIHKAVTRGLNLDAPLKPSGISWLGDIPAHWEVKSLNAVLVQRKEKNSPVKTTNILSLSLHDGVIPYNERTRPGGNKAKDDLSAYMLAYPGDIVVNSMNVVVGSVGLSKHFGAVSPVYYMLRPRGSQDLVEYFSAVFQDTAFQRGLFGLGNGIMVIQSKSSGKLNTIRMRIPMNKLGRVQLPYPGKEEQKAIVAYLAEATPSLDRTIERIRLEVQLLGEYRTRLTADVVTGKLDVREAAKSLPTESEENHSDDTLSDPDLDGDEEPDRAEV